MSHPSIAAPVARAVAALVGTGATLTKTTARQLLDSWEHRASLTPEQADQAAAIASGAGPLPAETVAAVGRIVELAELRVCTRCGDPVRLVAYPPDDYWSHVDVPVAPHAAMPEGVA